MEDTEAAWVAGIIDGEGTISLDANSRGWRYPTISAASTDIEILEELHRLCRGTITRRKKKQKPTHSTSWQWRMKGGPCVIDVLERVLPYMRCPAKVQRAKRLLADYFSVTKRNGHYDEEELATKRTFEAEFLAIK